MTHRAGCRWAGASQPKPANKTSKQPEEEWRGNKHHDAWPRWKNSEKCLFLVTFIGVRWATALLAASRRGGEGQCGDRRAPRMGTRGGPVPAPLSPVSLSRGTSLPHRPSRPTSLPASRIPPASRPSSGPRGSSRLPSLRPRRRRCVFSPCPIKAPSVIEIWGRFLRGGGGGREAGMDGWTDGLSSRRPEETSLCSAGRGRCCPTRGSQHPPALEGGGSPRPSQGCPSTEWGRGHLGTPGMGIQPRPCPSILGP